MSDLKDELRQERREKEWAETWKPEAPGDMLIGTLEAYDTATTSYGEYRVAHVRNEDGVLKGLWLMHSVLQDEWKEAGPEVGDRVGALYHGQRDGDQFSYHMWSVKVDRSKDETAAGGNDRAPQASGAGDFDGSDLWGEPAVDTEGADTAGSEEAPQESEVESTLDDPNGGLPF